jgi:hypothetical protein
MGGTVKDAANFDAGKDADALRKAMKGLGTDEQAIINIVCNRSNKQRQEIVLAFKQQFGRDLHDDLKSEISGHFLQVVQGLFRTPAEEDAFIVHHAIAGAGTDEEALIEVICTRSNAELKAMKEAYQNLYKKDAEKDVIGDTSGDFKRLLVSLLTAHRADTCDAGDAKADAEALYKAGEGKLGTDESKFNQILAARSYAQLRLTFDDYHYFSKNDIQKAISSEFSGDMKKGLLAIVKVIRNPAAYFAEGLYHSMKGAGTHDDQLIRMVVTRCEVDMEEIKHEFEKLYKKSLGKFIAEDTSGDYKKALIALVD